MNTWKGKSISISIFGESHGTGVGAVMDGFPVGMELDTDYIRHELNLRKPRGNGTTSRMETDDYEIISGVTDGYTNGSPICVLFRNKDVKSSDYNTKVPRPSHADFAAYVKYDGKCDLRGGGHFSARLTAPLVFFGALCRKELEKKGILSAVCIKSIGKIKGLGFYDISLDNELFYKLDSDFPLIDESVKCDMKNELRMTEAQRNSIGGTVECCIKNMPIGIGEPFFGSVESRLAELLFSIPAVKAVEFGKGFELSEMCGSAANDEFNAQVIKEKMSGGNNLGEIAHTNNAGGITGGLTNSMPLIFRVGFKPIPSIGQELKSIDMQSLEPAIVKTEGRHDVCAALRGAFIVRSVACIVMYDLLM